MRFGKTAMAIPVLLSLCVAGVFGQDNTQEPPPLMRVSSQLVLIDALVENEKTGDLVGNLQKEDFEVLEDDQPQTVSYFSHDQLPLSVVSSSTSPQPCNLR